MRPEAALKRFETFLREKRLRMTDQRRAILLLAWETHEHFTADDMFAWVRDRDSSASRATVYRTLALLVEGGFIDTLRDGSSEIAALVLEPLMTRLGLIPLTPDAVTNIAAACHEAGVLLVLDERKSGFRVARGGAAAWAGVVPDAAVYGSALGGGFPIGVAAFNDERTDIAPDGEEILATPHPVSLAAAEAVLSILENDTTYDRLEERSAQLTDGILNLADRFHRAMAINRVGSAFALYVGVEKVDSGSEAAKADRQAYRRLAGGLKEEGILLPPAPGGTAFVSSAHGAKDIEETLSACEQVLLRLHQEDLP